MKTLLKKIGQILSYPYRAGVEFVDTRPHINNVRDSLAQLTPVVMPQLDGPAGSVKVALRLGESDISIGDLYVADQGDPETNRILAEGAVMGFEAARVRVYNMRVSDIRAQNKLLRAYNKGCVDSKEVLANGADLTPEDLGGGLPQGA